MRQSSPRSSRGSMGKEPRRGGRRALAHETGPNYLQPAVEPGFDLSCVQAAVTNDRLRLGQKRCLEHLLPLLETLSRCRRFAADALHCLRPSDFSRRVRIGAVEHDEYGVALPHVLRKRYGLAGQGTWYVKFTLRTGIDGDEVLLSSLHALERPMLRVGGRLIPSW